MPLRRGKRDRSPHLESRFSQRPCSLIERGAGGHDIVDQQHLARISGVSRPHTPPHIPVALLNTQLALIRRSPGLNQNPAHPQPSAPHQQLRHSVPTTSKCRASGRHGHHQRRGWSTDGAVDHDGKCCSQRARQQRLTVFLHTADAARRNALVRECGGNRHSLRRLSVYRHRDDAIATLITQQRSGNVASRAASGQHEGRQLIGERTPTIPIAHPLILKG